MRAGRLARRYGPAAEQFTPLDKLPDPIQWNPLQPAGFLGVGWLTDLLGTPEEVHVGTRANHARQRLEAGQVFGLAGRPPAALLDRFTSGGGGGVFTVLGQPTQELVTSLVNGEPIPVQHQHLVPLVHEHGDRHPIELDHVMLPALPVGRLYVNQRQPHPPVVIDSPRPKCLPSSV